MHSSLDLLMEASCGAGGREMNSTRACQRLLLQARSSAIRQGILEGHRQLPPECSCLPRDQPCFLGGAKSHTVSLGPTFSKISKKLFTFTTL